MQKFKEVGTAVVGSGSPILGTLISFTEGVEPLLRFSSLVIGIIVGIFAIIHYWKLDHKTEE